MEHDLKKLAEEVLQLSATARAYLAEILLESLDFEENFPLSEAWLAEIRRRCQDIDNGKVELVPTAAALSALRKKYS